MSKAANVSYVDFQKKKSVTEQDIYNSWYDKWLDIKRACDPSKTIVHEAITFIAALEFLFLKNPDEIIFNKELLKKKCKQGPRQRSRFLAQLADIYEITPHTSYKYKGKEYHFVYSAKRSKDSLEILKNPKEFYRKSVLKLVETPDKNDLDTSQKCLVSKTNLTTTYTANPSSSQGLPEHRNPVDEEINHSYANGFISEKEKSYKKEKPHEDKPATFAPCSRAELGQVAHTYKEEKATHTQHKERTSENTGLFAMSDLMAKVLNDPQKEEEIPEMNLEDLPRLTEKEERSVLLSRTLQQAFGEQRSSEIQNDYKFVEQDQQKVCIQTKAMLLNDIEKAKIRKTIQSVYGEDVTISMQLLEPTRVEPHKQETPVTAKDMPRGNWLKFKASISDSNLLSLLNNRLVKVTEKEETLIIKASPLFIEDLTAGGHLTALEDAIVQTGITLELHYSGLNTSYTNAVKQKITLTPEQIIKDREWIRIHRKAINELDKK
jgi:hypothetical protein